MPENRSRLVWVGQQAFAFAVVATVAASAVGVVELEIVAPSESTSLPPAPERSLVATAPVEPTVRMVPIARGMCIHAHFRGVRVPNAGKWPTGNVNGRGGAVTQREPLRRRPSAP